MQDFRALGAPPLDPRASGGRGLRPQTPIGCQNSPPIADFWLRACYVLFVYVAVELSTFIMQI